MTISPTGIIPESLMYPAKLGEVMSYIKALTAPAEWKRGLLFGWARVVGVKLNSSQYLAVYNSGWDV
jgi:hypothetical protein